MGRAGEAARGCARGGAHRMISQALIDRVQCPDCRGHIVATASGCACQNCGRAFDGLHGYLDLRPRETFKEQTKYLDEALHADARHESVAPPLLGSNIRNDMPP